MRQTKKEGFHNILWDEPSHSYWMGRVYDKDQLAIFLNEWICAMRTGTQAFTHKTPIRSIIGHN